MLNTENIKKDFSIFTKYPNLVYLDSASTSQTPERVLAAMDMYYREARGNVHRGGYTLSSQAETLYEESRGEVARFIGALPEEIIFTAGSTHASNLLARSLEETLSLTEGDAIVVSVAEHHSVFVPLQQLAKKYRCEFRVIPLKDNVLDRDMAVKYVNKNTKILAVSMASNVTGVVNDMQFFAGLAERTDAVFIVDAAQYVGHAPISVRDSGADFLFFSGHKMCGPTGIGVLWGKKERLLELHPGYFGGGAVLKVSEDETQFLPPPACFEPGTPNIAGAIGLAEACRFLATLGLTNIATHTKVLIEKARTELSAIPGVTIFGLPSAIQPGGEGENTGIISFGVSNVHSHDIAEILARHEVAVRAGFHCAEPLVRTWGSSGLTRASFYLYNDESDVEKFIASVKKAVEIFSVNINA